jgi:hypothetical protein
MTDNALAPENSLIELPPVLKSSDVATLFHVSQHTVRLWVRQGHLEVSFRTPGGQARFTREVVLKLRHALRDNPTHSKPKRKTE